MKFIEVFIPSGENKKLDGVETWSVQWISRDGQFHTDRTLHTQIFTSEEQANEFAASLREAQKFLKWKENLKITIRRGP